MFKMAHQQIVCVFTVVIILLSKGCQSQQPACGRSLINSRILGGEDAPPGSWPWHATIEYRGQTSCQGSLINNQWVLTAAQCSVSYYLSGAVVHLGIQSLSGFNPNEVNRTIDYFICHEGFNANYFNNDICLVKLSSPVNFTDYIQPVCLASENSTFYDGTSSWVTGLSDLYGSQPNPLLEVNIPIIGNSKCNCFYENSFYYHIPITENMMCAGSENGLNGTSYGDQGAALVTKQGSIWVQSGIASLTFGNNIGKPGVYTRVSQYQKWISDRLIGTEPGFDTFTSTESDNDFNYTCATSPPTTPYIYPIFTYPTISPSTTTITTTTTIAPTATTDDSIFSSGVKLSYMTSLSALVFLCVIFSSGSI